MDNRNYDHTITRVRNVRPCNPQSVFVYLHHIPVYTERFGDIVSVKRITVYFDGKWFPRRGITVSGRCKCLLGFDVAWNEYSFSFVTRDGGYNSVGIIVEMYPIPRAGPMVDYYALHHEFTVEDNGSHDVDIPEEYRFTVTVTHDRVNETLMLNRGFDYLNYWSYRRYRFGVRASEDYPADFGSLVIRFTYNWNYSPHDVVLSVSHYEDGPEYEFTTDLQEEYTDDRIRFQIDMSENGSWLANVDLLNELYARTTFYLYVYIKCRQFADYPDDHRETYDMSLGCRMRKDWLRGRMMNSRLDNSNWTLRGFAK
jgi:hypothetical protein